VEQFASQVNEDPSGRSASRSTGQPFAHNRDWRCSLLRTAHGKAITYFGDLRAMSCGGAVDRFPNSLPDVPGRSGTVHLGGRMAKAPRLLSAPALDALKKVRSTLAPLDGVEETTTYGNPTFKPGGRRSPFWIS